MDRLQARCEVGVGKREARAHSKESASASLLPHDEKPTGNELKTRIRGPALDVIEAFQVERGLKSATHALHLFILELSKRDRLLEAIDEVTPLIHARFGAEVALAWKNTTSMFVRAAKEGKHFEFQENVIQTFRANPTLPVLVPKGSGAQ